MHLFSEGIPVFINRTLKSKLYFGILFIFLYSKYLINLCYFLYYYSNHFYFIFSLLEDGIEYF